MMRTAQQTVNVIAAFLLMIFFEAQAQFTRDWVAQYPGMWGTGVVADANGDIYVTGRSLNDARHNYRSDIVLIKYDLNGNAIWAREFDETDDATNGEDFPNSIALDPFGNIIVTGESFINTTGTDFITLKYDPKGNLLWKARYNSTSQGAIRAAADAAGNIYILGPSSATSAVDYVTIKYDANGNEVWIRTYHGPNGLVAEPASLAVTAAGDVAVTGTGKGGATFFDIATVVYDTNGNQRWEQRFDGGINERDYGLDVAFGPDGSVYAVGQISTSSGYSDAVVIKYDANGNQMWAKTHNGPAGKFDVFMKVRGDSQGNVIATGQIQETSSYADIITKKYDPSGSVLWAQTFAGPLLRDDLPFFLLIGPDDSIYLTGQANSDGVVTIKYDAAGVRKGLDIFKNSPMLIDAGRGLALDANGDVVVAAESPILTLHYDQSNNPCNATANFYGSPNTGCAPRTVNFTDFSSGSVTSWLWNFGDGATSTARNPSHTYNAVGKYTVSLTVTSAACSHTETKADYVIVEAAPHVEFVGSPTSGLAPLTVNFTDQSTGYPTSWYWDFGDGATSSLQNPTHTYTTPGSYPVLLSISNTCDISSTTKSNYIVVTNGALPPAPPSNLTATALNSSQINLAWTDNSNDEDGFKIERKIGAGGTFAEIVQAGANATNYFDVGVTAGTTYYYQVRAFNNGGNSTYSNTASATTLSACSNLALGKTATASSSSGNNAPNLAVDGDTSTCWSSSSDGTQYLQIDHGTATPKYNQVTIRWRGTRFAKSFQIRVSNNADFSTFTQVFSTATGTGGDQTLILSGAPRTERYIALHTTIINGSYCAVNEFEVCGLLATATPERSGDDSEATSVLGPMGMALHQNYPNPFNPSTIISFSLSQETKVTLKIYNLVGEEVVTLADAVHSAGVHIVLFDAGSLPSGVYLAGLQAGKDRQVRRLLLLK